MVKERVFQFALILSLVNFLIAASLGVVIRFVPFLDFSINTRYIIHAHSHVAFLGWVFIGLMALIYNAYFSGCRKVIRWFLVYLLIIQFSVFGMLLTFPFSGYALWSIVFSTMHMAASIIFIFYFKRKSLPGNPHAKPFIWMALFFMALSSLGPLTLGPLSVLGYKSGFYYDMAIYFYLHFQYNGWFTLAIVGILISMVNSEVPTLFDKKIRLSLWLLAPGILFTYLLSSLGYDPGIAINILGGLGAVLQLVGFLLIVPLIIQALRGIDNQFLKVILIFSLFALVSKFLVQFSTSFQLVVDHTYFNRDLIIAFLHWILLGFTSLAILGLLSYRLFLTQKSNLLKTGFITLISAFLLTEAILVFKMNLIDVLGNQNILIIYAALAITMFVGIGCIFTSVYFKLSER